MAKKIASIKNELLLKCVGENPVGEIFHPHIHPLSPIDVNWSICAQTDINPLKIAGFPAIFRSFWVLMEKEMVEGTENFSKTLINTLKEWSEALNSCVSSESADD